MAKAVLIDDQTVLIVSGDRRYQTEIGQLQEALNEPTDVCVVQCDVLRVVAATPESLQQKIAEELPEGAAYCHERLERAVYQVFSMPEARLKALRAAPHVNAVVPYAIAARNGQRSDRLRSDVTVITQVKRPPKRAEPFLPGQGEAEIVQHPPGDWAVIDVLGNQPIVTAGKGAEIQVVRALHADSDVQHEIFVTLQGASMPDSRIITHHQPIWQMLKDEGRNVQLVTLPDEAPSVGLLGLAESQATQFFLPAEIVHLRRRALQRQRLRSVVQAAVVFTFCLLVAAASAVHRIRTESDLRQFQKSHSQASTEHRRLFRERYAGLLMGQAFDLPLAWAELEMTIPPQLTVTEVSVASGMLRAHLERRDLEELAEDDLDVDVRDPPVTLRELRQAVLLSPMWRGATVRLLVSAHEISYSLEKSRAPAGN